MAISIVNGGGGGGDQQGEIEAHRLLNLHIRELATIKMHNVKTNDI